MNSLGTYFDLIHENSVHSCEAQFSAIHISKIAFITKMKCFTHTYV